MSTEKEAVGMAVEALGVACSKLARTLEPVAAVEAERSGSGNHPLELLLRARDQVRQVLDATHILHHTGLAGGAEVLHQQQAFGEYALERRRLGAVGYGVAAHQRDNG